jgi:predicted transcriptional regulator
MELTNRQKVFLSKLFDVYHAMKEPVHYSVVARRLGLNNSTAYDMLRVLEQKGMVSSQYDTPKETVGPGRSNIRFAPTVAAIEFIRHLSSDIQEQEEWEEAKVRILTRLKQDKPELYQKMLEELLVSIPESQSSLVCCVEVITALLLNLREIRQGKMEQNPVDNILQAPASKLRMSILAGLILGLSHADNKAQRMMGLYQEYTEKYEASLQALGRDSLVKLHGFTKDVWRILKTQTL